MRKDEITTRCSRCNEHHRVLDMVMDASGHGMTCRPCAGLAPQKTVGTAPTRARREFSCADCSFTFKSSSSRPICGYCSSKNLLTKRQRSADALLHS